jgi:hypothetical protein
MKDVIVIKSGGAGGDAFDLLVSFRATNTGASWFALAEAMSDAGMTETADAEFSAESIGIGPETIVSGTGGSVELTAGGDPGGGPAGTSWYQARLSVADANDVFVDGAGDPAPGLYRLGCAVNVTTITPDYADAYYQQDLLVRVVEQP